VYITLVPSKVLSESTFEGTKVLPEIDTSYFRTKVLSYYRTKVLSQVQYLASYHKYFRTFEDTVLLHVLHVKYIQFVNIQYNITLLPGTNASILRKSWISCRAARESTANGFFFHECMSLHPFLLDHLDRSFGEMCECPGHGGTLLSRITTV